METIEIKGLRLGAVMGPDRTWFTTASGGVRLSLFEREGAYASVHLAVRIKRCELLSIGHGPTPDLAFEDAVANFCQVASAEFVDELEAWLEEERAVNAAKAEAA